jgi:ABC-type polysaccharide/polyol phosphate transport system ATPase subunit
VGDIDFREKSAKVLDKFLSEDRTVITASHDLDFIKRNCNRVIWIGKGKLVADGPATSIIKRYKSA